jgi:hypothetical protein
MRFGARGAKRNSNCESLEMVRQKDPRRVKIRGANWSLSRSAPRSSRCVLSALA